MEPDTSRISGKAPKTAPQKVQSKKILAEVEGFSISGIYIRDEQNATAVWGDEVG